jgi:hypothetical protein
VNPTTEMSMEKFQQEIVEAGLHRLAQPLTAALWTLEAAGPASASQSQVGDQVRRAIGVLRMVRNLLNAVHPYQDPQPEDIRLVVTGVGDDLSDRHVGTRLTLVLDDTAASHIYFVPGEAFRTALTLLIEDFLRMGLPSCAAHLTLSMAAEASGNTSLVLAIALHSPALTGFDQREIQGLVRRVQPLDDSSFDFAEGVLPGAALAQAIFASIGISLEVAMHPDTLHYRLNFPMAAQPSALAVDRVAEVLQ